MRKLYAKELNKYNQFTDLVELEQAKLDEMLRINEAIGQTVQAEISVDTELANQIAEQNQALIEHFDRTPRNRIIVQTLKALNRDRLTNQLFLLKTQEVAEKSNRPLTLTERHRLNQEIESMNNEILLQNVATLEATAQARQSLRYEKLQADRERLERRRRKEQLQALVNP